MDNVETTLAVRLQWLPSLIEFSFEKWKTWKNTVFFISFGGRERGTCGNPLSSEASGCTRLRFYA